ncbi:undecaprenyl/decaprenyl-phosphate alpha-N-acetylglucosaminyl 1-phosphate transferase [Candidatus Woesebacteria bacterium]|nr:undecaprenyl/decaprenyl-phosphate alpha-N-acetylglucosaminyl 1-phosphate transferase [Candidatus Woesebacteria bacterium]
MYAALVAFFLALGLTPLIIRWYTKRGWLDDPTTQTHVKKVHTKPVPRGGGIVLYLAIALPSVIFLELDKYLGAILLGGLILTIVGWVDDIKDLSPYIRLVANLAVALLVVGAGIGIAYISNPFGGGVIHLDQPQLTFWLGSGFHSIWILADLFAVLFIIWNMNSINWASGLDGQMTGFTAITAAFIGILSTRFTDDPTQFNTLHLCFIVAGAYLGYLFWNWYPQKSMPGYGGSTLAGFFLSVLAILSGAKVATILMAIAVPTADAIFTIARRILAGKSPFWGDRGHLHHKLIDILGWSKPKVAIFYWATSLGLGLLSLYLNTQQKLVTMILVFALVFGFLIWAKRKSLVAKK